MSDADYYAPTTPNGRTVQPGDFAVCSIAGRGGKIIRALQWANGDGYANYEHALVYVGRGMILQAEPGGSEIVPYSSPADVLWSTGAIKIPKEARAEAWRVAQRFKGIGYSDIDYAALALHRLHIPAPYLKSYIRSGGHMICSQLVDRYESALGVSLFADGRWPGYVTPGALGNLIRSAQP